VSFHCSLSDMKIPSDFGVVASLQEQIYDLLLPGPHLVELFFHALHLTNAHPATASGGPNQSPGAPGFRVLIALPICIHLAIRHPKG